MKNLSLDDKVKKIAQIFPQQNTLIKTGDLIKHGLRSENIALLTEQGKIEKLKHGYYRFPLKDDWNDETIISILYPDGVLCMYTALFYYGYSDRTPLEWDIAIDRNTSRSRFKLDYPYVKPYYMKKNMLTFGIDEAEYPACKIKIFDRDRIICECVRNENKIDKETYNKAIQGYINDSKRSIPSLISYAKKLNIFTKVKERIGIWL